MAGWTDVALGVTEETRAEREHRKIYVEVLAHLPAGCGIDHLRADGSRLKIYSQSGLRSAEPE